MLAKVVAEAQRHLREHPFDALHSVSHARQVWKNCLWIIKREGLKDLDMEALQIAAWWHDVQRDSEKHDWLKKALSDHGSAPEFTEKVVGIINGHSFEQPQSSTESEVLYDADKLEYLSIDRVITLAKAKNNRMIGDDRFEYYKKAWAQRIQKVRQNIHFDSVKKRFENRYRKFLDFIKNDPVLASISSSML